MEKSHSVEQHVVEPPPRDGEFLVEYEQSVENRLAARVTALAQAVMLRLSLLWLRARNHPVGTLGAAVLVGVILSSFWLELALF